MRLVTQLLERISAESTLTHRYFFTHAGVEPRLLYNWKYRQPESWGPWMRAIRDAGIEVPKPGESTIAVLGGYEAAKPFFLEAGYQYNQIREWEMEGDPRTIENYKKLFHALNNLPDELRKSRAVDATEEGDA